MDIFKTQEEKEKWLKNVERIEKWCVDCIYKDRTWMGDPCHECLGVDVPKNAESYVPMHYTEKK